MIVMPNKRPGVDAGWPVLFAFDRPLFGTTQAERLAAASTSQIMKPQQTTETQCGCPRKAVKWGKPMGYGIAMGTVLGTVVGVATKNSAFVYIGMFLGAAIGAIFKSEQAKRH